MEIEYINRSVRLKVTSKCSLRCQFCHKEGGSDCDDVFWNERVKDDFLRLRNEVGVKEIHYTGGEPSCNLKLETLTSGLLGLGYRVKMTSNAQFSEQRLQTLIASGINDFNFSIPSLEPVQFLKMQDGVHNIEWANTCVNQQLRIVHTAITSNANVKVNILVRTPSDIERCIALYRYAKVYNISIRFLNDITAGSEAINAIKELVHIINGIPFGQKSVYGSSSVTSYYQDTDGFLFCVKDLHENKLLSLCDGCNVTCKEYFYAIRVEQRHNNMFVRLCIDRNDGNSYMPLRHFLSSNQLKDIMKIVKTNGDRKELV